MNDRKVLKTKDVIVRKGKKYYPSRYYIEKYDLSNIELRNARAIYGLPYVKDGSYYYYYNEQEFNDFYAGRIGKPTREYNRKEA